MELIGQLIDGRYGIVKLLGKGAMAFVFEADDEKNDGHKVAIKVMQPPLDRQPPLRKRFKGEFEACERLDHRNIVKVYSMGELPNGSPYYAMEYLPYPALDDVLLKEVELSVDMTINYLRQIASAFDAYHPTGVVHRDLKPANIIVTDEDRVVLVDFGLARDVNRTTLTKTGTMIGTPLYLSPDILMGLKVDGRSDIFSLGAIGYEMLTGEKAFGANTLEEVVSRIMHGRPKPVTDLVPGLSPSWNTFFRQCFRRKPEQRFQNGAEVIEALDKIAMGGVILPKGISTRAIKTQVHEAVGDSSASSAVRQVLDRFRPDDGKNRRAFIGGMICAFSLLVVGLFFIGQKAGWWAPKNYTVTKLKAEAGVGEALVTWQSEEPYPSRVYVKELERVFHGVGGPTSDHQVLLSSLGEGKSYSFKVLLPNGATSIVQKTTTKRFEFRLQSSRVDDNSVELAFFAGGAQSVVLLQKNSAIRAKRDGEDLFVAPLPSTAKSALVEVTITPENKKKVDLKELLSPILERAITRLKKTDPAIYTKGLHGRTTASMALVVDKMGATNESHFNMTTEQEQEEENRRLAARNKSRDTLMQRLEERGVISLFQSPLTISAAVLGTKLFPLDKRFLFYENIWKLASFRLFIVYQEAEVPNMPWPELGEFGCYGMPLPGEAKETLIYERISDGKTITAQYPPDAPVVRVGSRTPFMTDHVPSSWRTKFKVESLNNYESAEFQTELSAPHVASLALVINGRGPIYHYTAPIVTAETNNGPFFQRFPIELLQEGENDFELTFDAMHGQLSRRTMHLRRLKLRLIEKNEK